MSCFTYSMRMNLIKNAADMRHTLCPRILQTVCRCFASKYRDPNYINDIPVFTYPVPNPSDRRVYAWGISETGALGHYTAKLRREGKKLAEYHHRPMRLTFAELYKVEDIACGYGFTVFAVKPEKGKEWAKVFGCGINTDSQIGYHAPKKDCPLGLLLNPAPIELPFKRTSTRIVGLAAGRAHLLILTDQEGVFALGNNAYGQCGRPVIPDEDYSGSRVVHVLPNVDGRKIIKVECGQDHSMFITDQGTVYAFGWGADGQIGQGHYNSVSQPSRVIGDVEGECITKVASAGDCVLALSEKGEVFGWGNSEYGQFGSDVLQLSSARHLSFCKNVGKIIDIAAGGTFCMVLNEEGRVFVWGYGILGKGPRVERSLEPTEIPPSLFGKNELQPDAHVTSIACGLSHLMAVTNSGNLYAWGHNRGGCLGLGHTDDQFFPFKVSLGAPVLKVCCGVDHTTVLCQPY